MTRLIDCPAQKDMSNGYVVPDTVEEIADSAFIYNETLSYIVFPPSLRTIGEEAFLYNSSLSCVEFNDNLESIGARAFCDCASLRRICLGSGKNLELGPYAFQYCEPELLYVPSGLEDITMYFTSFDVENFSEDFVIVTDRADSMFAVDICPDYGIEPVIDPDFTGPHKASEPKSENQVAPGAECAGGYDTAVYCEFCGKELSRNHTVLNAENVKWKENSSFSGTVYPNFIVYMRAELENMPEEYSIVWYDESGKEFEEKRMAGSTAVTEVETEDTVVYAKVFDENGNAALDSNGNEIVNKCEIKVKTGFFAGLIGKIARFLKLNKAGIDGNKCVYGRKMISIMLGL